MAGFVLKVKTKTGQIIIKTLTPLSTIADLINELSTLINIPAKRLHVLSGFPPKPLNLEQFNVSLESCGLQSGETLIVEEKQGNQEKQQIPRHTSDSQLGCPGILRRKIVPADNSCLFTSVGFVLGGKVDVTCGSYMRQIIAEVVSNDEDNYSEAILGKPNKDYCDWIQKPDSWGGAIELSVLCKVYGLEIAVVDTMNAIINRFGEDQFYDHRVFLLFDGIHYDPLYLEPVEADGSIQTLFPTADEQILQEAEQMAIEAKANRQYTDVNKFCLRCIICNVMLTGQAEAARHAQESGHGHFGEVYR